MPELIEKEKGPTIAPKSEAQLKAKENKEKRDLPMKPGDAVSFGALLEWLKLLTEEQCEGVDLYVYRTRPVINRQYTDPNAAKYIDVIVGSKDNYTTLGEEYFRSTHGGGKYKIMVTPQGKTNKGGFFYATLEIPMVETAPILDLKEVDWTHPSNAGFQTYCRAKGLIDEKNMPTIERKDGTVPNNDAMVQAMKLAMDFATKMDDKQQAQLRKQLGAEDALGKSIGDILLEKMKQDDPNKQITTLATLMTAMKGMQPEVPKSGLTEIIPFLQMMQTNADNQFKMMLAMMEKFNSKPEKEEVDELDRLEKLLNVAQKIKGGRSVSEDSGEGVWEKIIGAIQAIAPQGLALANNVMVANMAAKGVQGVQPSPPVGQVTTQQPNTAPSDMGGKQMIGNMSIEQKQMMFKQFSPFIEKALNDSKEGWEFACDVEALMGKEAVALFIKDGEGPLLEVAQGVPEVWGRLLSVYGDAHLTKWVSDLVNYEKIRNEQEKEAVN